MRESRETLMCWNSNECMSEDARVEDYEPNCINISIRKKGHSRKVSNFIRTEHRRQEAGSSQKQETKETSLDPSSLIQLLIIPKDPHRIHLSAPTLQIPLNILPLLYRLIVSPQQWHLLQNPPGRLRKPTPPSPSV